MSWSSTWDKQCEDDFNSWIDTDPDQRLLDACADIFAILREGYQKNGPNPGSPVHHAVRSFDERKIKIYGHSLCGGEISLYVGIFGRDIHVLIFGPSEKYTALDLAKERAERWVPSSFDSTSLIGQVTPHERPAKKNNPVVKKTDKK